MLIRKGTIRLGMGHSLIIGHGPRLTLLEAMKADDKRRLESFGLFNIVTPDTSTYYQDVKPEDLTPKPEDYIKPIFRGLSEVIVRKNFDPIDFAHEAGVLKDSMPLLMGQSVFTNHEAAVGNEVGVVSNTFWDKGYVANGFNIPAGINFEAMIDGKLHPKLVRDIQSEPPTVHSNSVTVQFKWAQSHPKMTYDEFRSKVGTFDDKKQLIRRIVTGIDAYHETSFVAHGADPYAQKIGKDGQIVNPKYAAGRDSFSEERKVTNYYFSDCKTSFAESFEEETIPDDNNIIDNEDSNSETQTKFEMNKKLILLLASVAGVTLTTEQLAIPDAEFAEKFDFKAFNDTMLTHETKLTGFKTLTDQSAKVTQLETENTDLKKFKTDNEGKLADLAAVDTLKATTLAELLRVSKLVTGAEPSTELKTTYEAADLKTVQAFLKPLEAQLDAKFPMECAKCHSTEVHRASVSIEENEDKGKKKTANEVSASMKKAYSAKLNRGFVNMAEPEDKK